MVPFVFRTYQRTIFTIITISLANCSEQVPCIISVFVFVCLFVFSPSRHACVTAWPHLTNAPPSAIFSLSKSSATLHAFCLGFIPHIRSERVSALPHRIRKVGSGGRRGLKE